MERSVDPKGGSSEKLNAPSPEAVRAFVRTYAVEEVQKLARSLLWDGGSVEQREQLVESTYKKVTQIFGDFPTVRNNDVIILSSVVKALFKLERSGSDHYSAEDIFCSDIADVCFRNKNNGVEIEFIHNLLSTIQRIGVFANRLDEDSDKNLDANEEFLTLSAEELEAKLRVSKREFFHRI